MLEPHARDVVHGALQVPALLAVELQKGAADLHHLLGRLDLGEEMRHLGLDAAVAGDVDLPARVDADDAHVLDAALGAVARAAAHRQLDLVRRVHAPQRALQVAPQAAAVLRAEAAPFAAHAGLHGAQALAVGMTAGHADVVPHGLQVFLLHAQEVDALAARDLDGGDLVLVHHVGNAAQLGGAGLTAPHARHHAVRAVLLDVGVAALVDGAALRIVQRLLGPGADQVVVDGRAALGAAVGRLPLHEGKDLFLADQVVGAYGVAHGLVAMLGAGAHGLSRAGRLVGAAHGGHEDLLDEARARSAAGAGLGVLAHLVDGEQALFLDGLADRALGHAVAAADLGIVGHAGRLVLAGMAGVADVALAKHQLVAQLGHAAALAQQLEVPAAVHGVAVQAGADELVVLEHELLVLPAAGVAEQDLLGALAAHEVAGGEQVYARDFQLGRGLRALVAANAELRQMVGQDLALLEQRRHQAIGHAPVRGAFAHGVDARVGSGLHGVVDHDAAVDMQAHGFGQGGVGAYAHGHDDQVGRHLAAVLEAHCLDAAVVTAEQLLGLRRHQKLHAALDQRLLQHLPGHGVELALHQPFAGMHHGDLHAALHQAVGGLQAQQPPADHHRVLVFGRGINHGLGVGNVAVGEHAVQVLAGNRQHEGIGARRQDQPVVGHADGLAIGPRRMHHAPGAVDFRHRAAGVQGDAVVLIPGPVVEHDLLQGLLAGQHGREQDAVVVGVWLGAEHRDVIEIGRELEQLLQRAHARHAIAYQHELGSLHCSKSCDKVRDCFPGADRTPRRVARPPEMQA